MDDIIVGTCGLTSINYFNGTAEFSLFIAPEHQRKGYARKALKLLLEYGFETMGMGVIWGETFIYPKEAKNFLNSYIEVIEGLANPAWNMFKEVGFVKEGFLRDRYQKFGYNVCTYIFSIRSSEWKAFNTP